MVEEAGGTVSLMDGGKFCVFDRSVLVSNGVLHAKVISLLGDVYIALYFMINNLRPISPALKSFIKILQYLIPVTLLNG
jgi:hypothetical protein